MKILQVNCVYNKGSTGKIVHDIHVELQKRGIESIVCYGRGKKVNEANVHKTCGELYAKANNLWSRITGLMYGGCFFSTNRLITIIKKEKPDVVHLHCINGYFVNIYRLIAWLKKHRVRTILTLHAEFMYTANCGHAMDCEKWKTGCGNCPRLRKETKSWFIDGTARSWKKMQKAFAGFERLEIVAVSDWIAKRATDSLILKNYNVLRIHNGIDLANFCDEPTEDERSLIERKYGIPQSYKIVLHVTPGFRNSVKGGEFFLQLAELLPDDYCPVVVGCDGNLGSRIVTIPFVESQRDLAAMYRTADVFVITSRADNYPTVCLEANCCGTPVVGFDVGGVCETIGAEMGCVVPAFSVVEMVDKSILWAESKATISKETLESRRKYCCRDRMVEDYLNVYDLK